MSTTSSKNTELLWSSVTSISLGASSNSDAIFIGGANRIGISTVVSSASSPVGSLSLQISNDAPDTTPSNWSTITSPTTSVVALITSEPNCWVYDLCATWIRVVYTRTSGSGTLAGRITIHPAPNA